MTTSRHVGCSTAPASCLQFVHRKRLRFDMEIVNGTTSVLKYLTG
jgi:hypothetical protein